MVLASRSTRPLIPIIDAPVFIAEIIEVFSGRPKPMPEPPVQ
jgi:hypothetical protein